MEKYLDKERHQLLASVSSLYYNHGMTQSQIAARFYTSRSKISRLLQEARDLGVVKISIYEPWNRDTDLEERVKERFSLKDARILSFSEEASNEEILKKLGEAAAYYLDGVVDARTILGISWGYTVYQTVSAINSQKNIPFNVVPIMGAATTKNPEKDSMDLAKQLAMAYGAKCHYIYAPLFVGNETVKKELVSDRQIKASLSLAERANVILTSVGSIQYRSWKHFITMEDMAVLQRAGAIGHIGGHFYDIYGNEVITPLTRCLIAVSMAGLQKCRNLICVAGLLEKAEAILGALNGRLVNTLIIDRETAVRIIEQDTKYQEARIS